MASTPSPSTPGSKYDVTSRISELLDKYFSSMPPVSEPSTVFTSGPNRGLPVAAMPPSATPFRQKSAPRRVSKVTAETAGARASRAARPAKLAERFARNAPKPPELLARADQTSSNPSQLYRDPPMFPRGLTPEQLEKHMQESRERLSKSDTSPPKQPRPGPRPAPYSTRTGSAVNKGDRPASSRKIRTGPTTPTKTPAMAALDERMERLRRIDDEVRFPSDRRRLSETIGGTTFPETSASGISSLFKDEIGNTPEDFRQARELIDIANTQKQMDIARALEQRRRADAEIARTQQEYSQRDADFRRRMIELENEAYVKHMQAQRAGRREAATIGRALGAADAMGRYAPFDPLASFGRMIGFGQ